MAAEATRLLHEEHSSEAENPTTTNEEQKEAGTFSSKTSSVLGTRCILKYFFLICSFMTFQYVRPVPKENKVKKKRWCRCFSIAYFILFTCASGFVVNFCPAGVFLADWIKCPIEYYNICYILEFHGNNPDNMPVMVMRDNEDHRIDNPATRAAVQPFDDLAKFTLLFIVVSGALSYVIFIFALFHHYYYPYFKRQAEQQPVQQEALHPFDDEPDTQPLDPENYNINRDIEPSTELKDTEQKYFYGFLIANIVFLLAAFILFVSVQYSKEIRPLSKNENKTNLYEKVEIASVVTFFYSHWCTVISCFIFAKLMYGIQKKLQQKTKAAQKLLKGNLSEVITNDKKFIECATKTLHIFQLWFFVHWVFYIITSFLTIALSIEAILLLIRATQHHIQDGVHFSDYEIILLVLLSVSNVLMFIYPCFRAGSITRARKKFIRHIIKEYSENKYSKNEHSKNEPSKNEPSKNEPSKNEPSKNEHSENKKNYKDDMDLFIKYLQSSNFGFRLYVGCTYIPFNLNVAYTSILIGAFGIVLSILTSIAV